MEKTNFIVTICFEAPFWVGIYEREYDGQYQICKITFGAEPKDYEVYEFLLKNFGRLRFSPSTKANPLLKERMNPKRMQRQIKKQVQNTGVGTKAQQALKLQHEQNKLERKKYTQEQKEGEKARKFQLKQKKRKEKHRGH